MLSLLGGLLGGSSTTTTAPSNTLKVSPQPIFLDNLKVSAATGFASEVDVQLWAVYPNGSPNNRWFRIRSMATCALPPVTYTAPDSLDTPLRRYSLRHMRPQLKKDDVGDPMSIQTPSTSRTIEVLVEPILPFELAIFTLEDLKLGTSGNWSVDSYDSRDPNKSGTGGTYPGRTSTLVQENGNIGSDLARSADSLYGPLVSARGAQVRGAVATNGGDDPATPEHENVSGAINIDPARIRSDFYRDMPAPKRPTAGVFMPAPLLGAPFVAGTESAPSQYIVGGNLGGFTVEAPASGKGAIIILINGDLDVGNADITIPPGVAAQIYVRGNIDFHNQSINTTAGSSQLAGELQIYGEDSGGDRRTLNAGGNASIAAAFYGPSYDVRFSGKVEWFGSVASRSFEMQGGGNGGFHYDEALGPVGNPISFRIARYVEDVRE
ncbi:MAG TPA: hypothetical protein VEO95_11305 [Chthoniobacteraceae bacterium]|nr:hypothetical protein [Chthoniobacteraceae bacterium]